jgi:methanogenic corrinoid protein MtbC1
MSAAIERDIIPRLLQSHRVGPFPPGMLSAADEMAARPAQPPPSQNAAHPDISPAPDLDAERVLELVRRLTAPEDGTVDASVDGFLGGVLDEGFACEAIYLDLLAPAARQLGVMWEDDTCDFVQVTLALGRMQRVLRSLSHLFLAGAGRTEPVGRILLTCLPGEQHTLGLVMVAEFFVREGWWTDLGHPVAQSEMLHAVRSEWYDVVGVSMACDSSLPRLKRELQAIRRTSRNPSVRLMVGGRAFDADPGLVRRVGADATAGDARTAPAAAAALLADAAR